MYFTLCTMADTRIEALKKYVRLTNYLSVAQIYLDGNFFLERALTKEDIKPRLLGHWGTCPGINFVYAHTNRLIKETGSDMIMVVGPGHGFPALQANLFVEGSLTHYHPDHVPMSKVGVEEICKKFSYPYGYPSHANPGAPGVILEGGELGYSLSVSYGSVLDNPELITVCIVGDGESETGPLSASWNINRLVNPATSGAVLPIVHINGYKISGPTVLGRMSDTDLISLYQGLGYEPYIVEYEDDDQIHGRMCDVMDAAYGRIREIQRRARQDSAEEMPRWPVILLKTPKGWSGPLYDGKDKIEGNALSHQVVFMNLTESEQHLHDLEMWLRSYRIDELCTSNDDGSLLLDEDITSLIPEGDTTMGQQKYVYGGVMTKALVLPELPNHLVPIPRDRCTLQISSMIKAGEYLRDVFSLNSESANFRLFCPDETYSNKLQNIFEVTQRAWMDRIEEWDHDLSRSGRVMELLSETTLFGLMEGYTLTGRHGIFVSYEAFTQIVASMADQYAKFIKLSQEHEMRKPVPAMNIIMSSLLERQDHNGFSHQNPSFISSMMEKDGDFISCYFPPDVNTMLYVLKETLESHNALNIIVANKNPQVQWLSDELARKQVKEGIMTWEFVSEENPDLVLASCGDTVTMETIAARMYLKEILPQVRLRCVNVSELTALSVGDPTTPISSSSLDEYFTPNKGVVYTFHGYPQTIKKLLYDYTGNHRIKINGYEEHGSTTTPFDMHVRNGTSRYHIVRDALHMLYNQGCIEETKYYELLQNIQEKISAHRAYILAYGTDPDDITNWYKGLCL